MISLSHWGMFPVPQEKHSRAWYDEQRGPDYRDPEYIHNVFQRLRFGDLP